MDVIATDPRAGAQPGDLAVDHDGPCCNTAGPQSYLCTREIGHPGQHIAEGDCVIETWSTAVTAADVKRAEAVSALEAARHQAVIAADALTAAGLDASGALYVVAEIDRELTWLRG